MVCYVIIPKAIMAIYKKFKKQNSIWMSKYQWIWKYLWLKGNLTDISECWKYKG